VERTIVDNPDLQGILVRVLCAYSRRNCSVGYCQGFNFMALVLLRAGLEEEEAFWVLAAMVELVLPMDYYTNMLAVVVDQKILQGCIAQRLPDLASHMAKIELDSSLFTVQWVICLFANTLPHNLVVALWDRLFTEGPCLLFKACLALT
jgi:hypothetical protein